jgi:multiple sugar transport system ATP-binding protein
VANELAPRERNIAMVFQSYALYPHLTVAENIGFGLRVRGMAKSDVAAKVKATAEILELDALLDRKPAQLSGGQRQRVAMGRAIVRAPRAFLMDEPLSNLDARLRVQMRTEIARIQRMAGITTIYVTHDQVEAMTMADRVAVIDRGILQQIGPPRALYHEPANLFVASFIGSPAIGLVEGRLASTADGAELILGSRRLSLAPSMLARKPALAQYWGGKIVVGIRPEALRSVRPGADPHASIPGTVAIAEDLGATLLVHLDVEAPPPRLQGASARIFGPDEDLPGEQHRGRVRASLDGLHSVRLGDTMEIAIDVERVHFFDPNTGDAIGR